MPSTAKALTLQLHTEGAWRTAAVLQFPQPQLGRAGPCWVSYDFDYVMGLLFEAEVEADPIGVAAIASAYPLGTDTYYLESWPAFLDDIRPAGAARRWWSARLGLGALPEAERDFTLLAAGTIAPIGNLRIAEAVPKKRDTEKRDPPSRFALEAVINRDHDFLEFAAERGASVGGATGAGGEAPKMLLRKSADGQVWIDTWQDEPSTPDVHYLVKFARNQRTARDLTVLRSEFVYYQALTELGVSTIDTRTMALHEGEREPSLWLPRFDVEWRGGRWVHHGMESLYALIDAPPGSWQTHQTYLAALHRVMGSTAGYDQQALIIEYLRRDLLNVIFGNSDNHGRNTAVLRTERGITLAPVFDFAPMKMDPEGIIRTTRWEHFERGGQIDWSGLVDSFADCADPQQIRAALGALAERLITLPTMLRRLGCPEQTLGFPAIGLANTEGKLRSWGLLP